MKKSLFILFLFIPFFLNAQVKKPRNLPGYDFKTLHFGFTIGFHSQDLSFIRAENADLFADVSDPGLGFQVTIVSDLRLSENWNLRFLPGIALGEKTISFYNLQTREFVEDGTIESNYLDFPLLLKYRSKRINNVRPYLIGGLNYRYDLAARKESDENDRIHVKLKPSDLYLEGGFGIDYYLQYFKFSPEIKVGMGLRNILVKDNEALETRFVNSIDHLRSFIVMINFHFE
ncbi:MAG: porin family protein [Bacteroidota bacterium]